MLRARTVGLGIVLVVGGGAASVAAVANAGPLSHSRQEISTISEVVHKVVVNGPNSNIVVVGGETTSVQRNEHWSFGHPHSSARVRDGVLTVQGSCRGGIMGGCSVNYRITVPSETSVEVNSTNGKIILQGLDGSSVNAHTTNGSIVAQLDAVSDATLESTNGSIVANVPKGDYSLDLTTTNGHVVRTGVTDGNESDRHLHVHTTNGNVAVVGS